MYIYIYIYTYIYVYSIWLKSYPQTKKKYTSTNTLVNTLVA